MSKFISGLNSNLLKVNGITLPSVASTTSGYVLTADSTTSAAWTAPVLPTTGTSLTLSGLLKTNALYSTTTCPQLIPKTPSENVRNAHSGSVTSVVNTSYQMLRTIVFTNGLKGTQRFKWSVYNNMSDNSVYSKLRKNGVDIVASRPHSFIGWTSYSEDVAVNWLPGDQLEFWAYSEQGNIVPYGIDVFAVCYDDLPDVAVAYTVTG